MNGDEIRKIMLAEAKAKHFANVCDRLSWINEASSQQKQEVIENYSLVSEKGRFTPHNFSNWIIDNSGEHYLTIIDIEGTNGLMRYSNGVYSLHGAQDIETIVSKLIRRSAPVLPSHFKQIIGTVKADSYIDRDELDSDKSIVNIESGLCDIIDGTIQPHTPAYPSIMKHPIKINTEDKNLFVYDPKVKCPKIYKTFVELVGEEYVKVLFEITGYIFRNRKNMKTGFIYFGQTNSGKSVVMTLQNMLLHTSAVSNIKPQTICNSEFGGAEVEGKLAIIVDDLADTVLRDTGTFKTIMGTPGSKISVQRKYGQIHDITPKAVFICGANVLPKVGDDGDAFAGRLHIVDFPNKFEHGMDGFDPDLIKNIATPEELSGFFCCSIAAMVEVDKRGSFTNAKTLDERIKMYRYNENPMLRFFDVGFKFDNLDMGKIERDTLYAHYLDWCDSNGIKKKANKGDLTTTLEKEFGVRLHRPKTKDGQTHTYYGISYKTVDDDDSDEW